MGTLAQRNVFMIGIGGMGMAPLAIYLRGRGYAVCGHDDNLSPASRAFLTRAGVICGRYEQIPENCDTLVYSSAVAKNHPLYAQALARGLEIFRRGECWAKCVENLPLVAVVGSHGKTTTTAMLVHLLEKTDLPFSYLIGGLYNDESLPPARFDPEARWVVSEIDESDGTIERFSPAVTVALNFDWDHPDRYRDEAALTAMFEALFKRTTRAVIIPKNCPKLGEIAKAARCEVLTFENAEDFNASNLQAALVATRLLCESAPPVETLEDFPGIRRRQDVLFKEKNLTVMADYAHHPTEISALLRALKSRHETARLCCVFQPHRYTRTRQYAREFAQAFAAADKVFLLPVYAASEPPLADGTHRAIVEKWKGGTALEEVTPQDAFQLFEDDFKKHDGETLLVFVGAGDIENLAHTFAHARHCRCLKKPLPPWVRCDEPLRNKTTLRVGGKARFYAEPENIEQLRELLLLAKENALEIFALGRGSNVLVADEGVDGLVIRLSKPFFETLQIADNGRIVAGAGVRLKTLCGQAATAGIAGFEELEGIPGNIGGALRMDAGANGNTIFKHLTQVEVMGNDGNLRTLKAQDMHPAYRNCPELENAIALRAEFFSAQRADPAELRARMEVFSKRRRDSQPRDPSAGSFFKNPDGDFAGRLIEQAGLKGWSEGKALVSPMHANFLVNTGGARADEILKLARRVQAEILKRHGIKLEPEVRQWGVKQEDRV